MRKKQRPSQNGDINTRDRLLNAALHEFNEKGYYLTNGDTIAKRAGLGHGTFYIYFKNKNEVLIQLLRRSVAVMPYTAYRNDPQYLMRHAGTPAELEVVIREMIKPLSEIPGLLKALLQGMLQDEDLTSFGIQIGRDMSNMFKHMITARKKEGGLRGCDARTLSEIIAVCMACSMLMTAAQIIRCSPETLSRNLCGIITPVLFPDKTGPKTGRLRLAGLDNDKKIRRELLGAAREEFIAHGYFETKIATVSHKSGYSRRTFYHYFKNKDELLKALFNDMLGNLSPQPHARDSFIEALDTGSIEGFVYALTMIVQAFDTPMNRAFLQGFFNSPDLTKLYNDMFALHGEPLTRKLVALKAQGQCAGVDPAIASYVIIATVTYTAYLRNTGFIGANVRKCAMNLSWFLYYFINSIKPAPS